ncbi:VanZ family protein [Romboutsia sp. 1001216sp1]|uniref:VanZ family protein n=1 Tax=Romboutsia sp. 1001216sp1 TaxID=2986997 RepID=UPI00232CE1AC|nr:VanZ family protein [Romboutsia sp. 1001216sp1]MDB8804413.1 VanZ family protein [Romboutsia sp. 1001216sp1]MDB8806663.1 VanZ family protein [Romboutsia sp. 1001216sp1]MDB8810061.1 VanZ family protein [Romboutsia sp. 1001216sp1]MDB8815808.1 VanZ family protein [Romboutsia sp. 1001216sp1]MDB8818258.1 VanZ family protein [Romboutsia sp. 1001216sp1]
MYSFELRGLLIFGLPIWIIARIIILINRRKKGIKFNIGDEILTNLFVIYLFLLIGITILPIIIGEMTLYEGALSFIERCNINIVPFIDYFKGANYFGSIIRNVVGNIVLLMPFILYICAKSEKSRDLKSAIKITFLISLSIELTQLVMNIFGLTYIRAVDVEDLILNTLGGIIAWGIFKLMYRGKIKSMIDNIHPQLIEENQIN